MVTSGRFRAYAAVVVLLTLVSAAPAKYSGGTGGPNDPYQITTAADLIALGNEPNDHDKHFILTADIDLDPNLPGRKVFDKAVIAPDPWAPFGGVFDGNGHTISHLTITGGSYLALFGRLREGAMIANLGLEAVEVNGTGYDVGGLVGMNCGRIAASYSTGAVKGAGSAGGLVGSNGKIVAVFGYGYVVEGRITNSYSTASVSGSSWVGGLVGWNWASVATSYSTGAVSGTQSVGGLVGSGGSVRSSLWDIQTSGQSGSAGGIGLTTAEMMDPQMLGLNGFANDPNWVLDAGRDYPRLAWQGTPGGIIPEARMDWLAGQGTPDSPYRIETADQLILIGAKAPIL